MKKNAMDEQSAVNTKQEFYPPSGIQDGKIDLIEFVRELRNRRRLIFWWCAVGAVIGIVIAFSIPKEYTVTVKLAPETQSGLNVPAGNAIADIIGLHPDAGNRTIDAVYPALYPDIVASTPFLTELFEVTVPIDEHKETTPVFDYLLHHTQEPWWNAAVILLKKTLDRILSVFRHPEEENSNIVDPFRLTRDQTAAVKALKKRIEVSVDKKTSVVVLSVTMQNALVSAVLTDTVMRNLQDYITRYRTNKARNDLAFIQKLFQDARADYYSAQAKYARYMDTNQNVVLRSVRTEQERLQNEMNLAYNVYNQTAQQLQAARAKVQESTPVYVVLQPASVPLKASKPSKGLILAGCVLLSAMAAAAWILYGKGFVLQLRE